MSLYKHATRGLKKLKEKIKALKSNKSENKRESRFNNLRKLRGENNPSEKNEKHKRRNIVILKEYLRKAGYEDVEERRFSKKLWIIATIIAGLLSIAGLIVGISMGAAITRILLFLLITWTVFFGLILGVVWVLVYLFLDLNIYKRTNEVEEVLPDFLQLTSANISAGMPIDQALWYAVRPKFGVLAKEIEEVAKSTIAGEDLETSLKDFSNKYDSPILKRSVSLMIEGMRSGGEIADLLSRISIDIQETKLMRKEIGASIMTYVIFITFASIVAAPFLFALSTELLRIIQTIMAGLELGEVSTGTFSLNIKGGGLAIRDFKIFSMLALGVTAIFSASIVSIIRKGSLKESFKVIPGFLLVSLVLYFVATLILSSVMGGFI